jgi:hypothetical protein
MNRNVISLGLSLLICLVGIISAAAVSGSEIRLHDDLVQAFVNHVESLSNLDETKKREALAALREDSPTTITDALSIIYPQFAKGIEATDSDDIEQSSNLLLPLTKSNDSFLAANASFYLARTWMNHERFEQAISLLNPLIGDLAGFSVYSAESLYYLGVAEAGLLRRDEAIGKFIAFLQTYPDAPERLRVSAWRQAQELQAIQDGQLSDVHRHMDYSRRRLEQRDTGEQTQEKQDRIVNMLAKLIKEEEKKELNSSSKSSSKNKPQPKENAQAPKPSEASQPNNSQEGGSSSIANGDVIQKTYDDSPASPWSRLRDRSRDPANNAIKEKLPARYRDIVEKYYEAANGTPPKSLNDSK